MNDSSPEQPSNENVPTPPQVETFSHTPVAARVPERIGRGTFCTGQLILDGPKEFVIDFVQNLTRPFQVVQRVVLSPSTTGELVELLRQTMAGYAQKFGSPMAVPRPANPRRPTLAEIYENFRIADDMLTGSYANTVLVAYSATEFAIDFITGFYPTSAVSARVFMAAPQIPPFIAALTTSLEQHAKRFGGAQPPQQPVVEEQPQAKPPEPPDPPHIAG